MDLAAGSSGVGGRLAAVAVVVLASPIAGCERPGPSTAAPAIPDVVEVVCSATGASASGTVVAARTDGVHVRIRNVSKASGMYINRYHATDHGWQLRSGSSIAAGVTDSVFSLPPGRVGFGCSSDATREGPGNTDGEPVAVEVQDRLGAWRTGALAALGCSPVGDSMIDWVYREPRGSSREAALKALVAQMSEPTTWRAAQEGYVAANQQSYVLLRDGKPWVSAETHRVAEGRYSAWAGGYCDDADLPESVRGFRTGRGA